jgi:hypothetical protein
MFPPGDTIRQERPSGFGSETHSNNPLTLECRALTQRRPWVRFDSRGTREPTRITRRAVILGRAARGPAFLRKATCQAWRVLFSFGPRSPTRAPPYRERQETRASHVLGAKGVFTQSRTLLDNRTRDGFVPAYSRSELMSGKPSDARALASISACSHCLRVRLFP